MKPTFKEYLINEAGYHGWREPEATDFHPGKVVRSSQLKRGMLLGIKYQGRVNFFVEVLGFTGNDKKYGEGGVQYNSQKEMFTANNVKSLKELEELDDKNEYGYSHYMKVRDLVDKEEGPWLYIFEGRWVIGSGADRVGFLEAKYVPAKKKIQETPFTDKQEKRFLTSLKQDVTKKKYWPSDRGMLKLVKKASPPAKEIGRGMYSAAYSHNRSGTVIKITDDGQGADTLRFLRFVQTKNNPHFPIIYSLKRIHRTQKDDYDEVHVYVRMEKLIKLDPETFNWKPKHVPFLEWMHDHGYGDDPDEVVEKAEDYGSGRWEALKKIARKKKIKSSRLVQAMQMIERLADEELDIHLSAIFVAHNIMVRPSTGEIVIHDPI